MEVLVKDYEEECADEGGVEKGMTAVLVGKLGIKISNLTPSPKLALRFDPAACVLTVCKASDPSMETEDQQYHVIHGVHCASPPGTSEN